MQAISKQLESTSDLDIPPRSWAGVTSAAARLTRELFPTGFVGLCLMDDSAIRNLNREHRGVDEATDVLSFVYRPDDAGEYLGEIALSWDAVQRQAKLNSNSLEAEAVALVTHALLHIAGYDHLDSSQREAMDARTRRLCKLVGYEVKLFGH